MKDKQTTYKDYEEFYREEEKYLELIKKYPTQYRERIRELEGCYEQEGGDENIYLSFRINLEKAKSEEEQIYYLASSHAVQKATPIRRPTPSELEEVINLGVENQCGGNSATYHKIARRLRTD